MLIVTAFELHTLPFHAHASPLLELRLWEHLQAGGPLTVDSIKWRWSHISCCPLQLKPHMWDHRGQNCGGFTILVFVQNYPKLLHFVSAKHACIQREVSPISWFPKETVVNNLISRCVNIDSVHAMRKWSCQFKLREVQCCAWLWCSVDRQEAYGFVSICCQTRLPVQDNNLVPFWQRVCYALPAAADTDHFHCLQLEGLANLGNYTFKYQDQDHSLSNGTAAAATAACIKDSFSYLYEVRKLVHWLFLARDRPGHAILASQQAQPTRGFLPFKCRLNSDKNHASDLEVQESARVRLKVLPRKSSYMSATAGYL